MNQLVKAGSATVSSVELLEKINELREQAGQSTLRRNVFNARIVDELEGSHYKTFVVEKDRGGSDSVAYELTYDQALLVGLRESKLIRRAVLTYLEQICGGASEGSPMTLARAALRSLRLSPDTVDTLAEARATLGDAEFWAFLVENKPIPLAAFPSRTYAYEKFSALEVGEGVEVPGDSAAPGACKDYGVAVNYGLRSGRRFSGRKVGDGKVLITRVS